MSSVQGTTRTPQNTAAGASAAPPTPGAQATAATGGPEMQSGSTVEASAAPLKATVPAKLDAGYTAFPIDGFSKPLVATNSAQQLFYRSQKYQNTYDSAGGIEKLEARSAPGGFYLDLDIRYQKNDPQLSVQLLVECFDPEQKKTEPVILAIPVKSEVLKSVRETQSKLDVGELRAYFSYDDINAYLAKASGGKVQVNPGTTPLTIAIQWDKGHRAGGPGEGTFVSPEPIGGSAATRAALVSRQNTGIRAEDIEIEKAVSAVDPGLYAKIRAIPQTPDAQFASRAELEGKHVIKDAATLKEGVRKMVALLDEAETGSQRTLRGIVGPGWNLKTVNGGKTSRFLVEEGESNEGSPGSGCLKGYRVDAEGLPMTKGYGDNYRDSLDAADPSKNFILSRAGSTVRLRKDSNKAAINIKPPGNVDHSNEIVACGEFEIPVTPATTEQQIPQILKTLNEKPPKGRYHNSVYNSAMRYMEAEGIDVITAIEQGQHLVDVKQTRYKFELEHDDKTCVELSFDLVEVIAMRDLPKKDGTVVPKGTVLSFAVAENELDHKQVVSENVAENGLAHSTGTTVPTAEAQSTFLKSLSAKATLDIEPTLHTAEELKHPGLTKTPECNKSAAARDALYTHAFGAGNAEFTPDRKPIHAFRVWGCI